MRKIKMLILKLIIILHISYISCLQCVDENNTPVDWFIAIKLPKLKHNSSLYKEGLAYLYMTSANYEKWMISEKSINSTSSVLGNTISVLYNNQEDLFHLLYNDEPPLGKTNEIKGHTKGVVLANRDGGVWIVHSTPHFPTDTSYSFPTTGTTYGQSFLCISLDLQNLNEVGKQLQYNQPNIYSVNIPDGFKSVSDLIDAAKNKTIKSAPWYRQYELISLKGQHFISFGKSKQFGKDLYSSWVATVLQSNLYVETWRKGPGDLPSECGHQFKVNNIEQLNLLNFTYLTTEDHSKWAVGQNLETSSWVCIGDINRQEHQLKRGGGTVCLKNHKIATNFLKSVYKVEEC